VLADAFLLLENLVDQALEGPLFLGAVLAAAVLVGPNLVGVLVRRIHD
jgi:hypothetical protein